MCLGSVCTQERVKLLCYGAPPFLIPLACVCVSCVCAGHLVSGYVKQHLPIILVNHMTAEKDVQKTLTSGFLEVDQSLSNSRIDCEFSGTTAVVSYLKV